MRQTIVNFFLFSKMTEPIDDTKNTKLIALKKFFIFNSKFGACEGDVCDYLFLLITLLAQICMSKKSYRFFFLLS